MQTTNQKQQNLLGFTLIELSIVLVIIGLIVGGVLVGQDLIKAAEVRATVGQYEKYNATVNTFRTKYNGIPGDLPATTSANAFGLCPVAGCLDGGVGAGDGNGLIQSDGAATTGNVTADGEILAFWQQMSAANLIDGNYGSLLTANSGNVAANTTGATIGTYLPPAKIGRGNYWNVASAAGINYYLLSGFGATPITTAGVIDFDEALTPIESFNIDVKVDDGMPNTGTVQARGDTNFSTGVLFEALSTTIAANYATPATSTSCITGGAPATNSTNTYARGTASGNSPNCILRMRFN